MKKQYKKPITESVKVNLYGSILDDEYIDIDLGSNGVLSGDAKENNFLFEDEGDFGDLWSDGDSNSDPYDLWKD